MKNVLTAIFTVFMASIPAFADEHNTVRQDHQLNVFYKIGSYTVKVLGYELYAITFYSADPGTIVARYLQYCVMDVGSEDPVDKLASLLLDPSGGIPVKLTIRMLTGKKNYQLEKESMIGNLARAGYTVDDRWNLLNRREDQDDLRLYVSSLLGLSRSQLSPFFKHREKGDSYIFSINSHNIATIEYSPDKNNKRAYRGIITFSSAGIVGGVISTYISKCACNPNYTNYIPAALLNAILNRLDF